MTSISSPKATDDPFGLPRITCARCHVRTTALETEALALSAHEFGTVCHAAYGHLTSATIILRRCWRHICFDKATALCDILYKCLRNIYLFTYLVFGKTLTLLCKNHYRTYTVYLCFLAAPSGQKWLAEERYISHVWLLCSLWLNADPLLQKLDIASEIQPLIALQRFFDLGEISCMMMRECAVAKIH